MRALPVAGHRRERLSAHAAALDDGQRDGQGAREQLPRDHDRADGGVGPAGRDDRRRPVRGHPRDPPPSDALEHAPAGLRRRRLLPDQGPALRGRRRAPAVRGRRAGLPALGARGRAQQGHAARQPRQGARRCSAAVSRGAASCSWASATARAWPTRATRPRRRSCARRSSAAPRSSATTRSSPDWPELGVEVHTELPDPAGFDAVVFAVANADYARAGPRRPGWATTGPRCSTATTCWPRPSARAAGPRRRGGEHRPRRREPEAR